LADFTWWSGLAAADARQAHELVKAQLGQVTLDGQAYWLRPNQPSATDRLPSAYLLPAFDEYFLGYTKRDAILDTQYNRDLVSNNGVFRPMLVIDGQVVGVWKQELSKRFATIKLMPFKSLNQEEEQVIAPAAGRYGEYLGLPVVLA
jgi:hypothetical protein